MSKLAYVHKAAGLEPEDAAIVKLLVDTYDRKLVRNNLRSKYYNDKTPVKNLGLTVPDEFRFIDVSVGWAAKAVDMLAARSILDGMTLDEGRDELLDSIMRDNDMSNEYDKAVTSELTHSCGFWTVSRGGEGEQQVVINYHDAESSAGIWDYRKRRIKAGMVIADVEQKPGGKTEPVLVNVYTDTYVIEIHNTGKANSWVAEYKENLIGRPLIEPMMYRPSYKRPFGKSRISRTVMGITDEMQREIIRTALHSELFSAPQKYLLGASEEALKKSKLSLYMDSILVASRDRNGNTPQFGQLQQASMEPHIAAMDKLASRMAAETYLPVAAFGVASKGYTSSDALRASTDDIILEAESLNKTNGKALRNVALMALAVAMNTSVDKLPDEYKTVSVHWKNPAVPSIASQTDAMVKQASIATWLPETSVFWEELGYSDEQRQRIKSERTSAQASAALYQRMFGDRVNDGGTDIT